MKHHNSRATCLLFVVVTLVLPAFCSPVVGASRGPPCNVSVTLSFAKFARHLQPDNCKSLEKVVSPHTIWYLPLIVTALNFGCAFLQLNNAMHNAVFNYSFDCPPMTQPVTNSLVVSTQMDELSTSKFINQFQDKTSSLIQDLFSQLKPGCGHALMAQTSGCSMPAETILYDYRTIPSLKCPQQCHVTIQLSNGTKGGYGSLDTCTFVADQVSRALRLDGAELACDTTNSSGIFIHTDADPLEVHRLRLSFNQSNNELVDILHTYNYDCLDAKLQLLVEPLTSEGHDFCGQWSTTVGSPPCTTCTAGLPQPFYWLSSPPKPPPGKYLLPEFGVDCFGGERLLAYLGLYVYSFGDVHVDVSKEFSTASKTCCSPAELPDRPTPSNIASAGRKLALADNGARDIPTCTKNVAWNLGSYFMVSRSNDLIFYGAASYAEITGMDSRIWKPANSSSTKIALRNLGPGWVNLTSDGLSCNSSVTLETNSTQPNTGVRLTWTNPVFPPQPAAKVPVPDTPSVVQQSMNPHRIASIVAGAAVGAIVVAAIGAAATVLHMKHRLERRYKATEASQSSAEVVPKPPLIAQLEVTDTACTEICVLRDPNGHSNPMGLRRAYSGSLRTAAPLSRQATLNRSLLSSGLPPSSRNSASSAALPTAVAGMFGATDTSSIFLATSFRSPTPSIGGMSQPDEHDTHIEPEQAFGGSDRHSGTADASALYAAYMNLAANILQDDVPCTESDGAAPSSTGLPRLSSGPASDLMPMRQDVDLCMQYEDIEFENGGDGGLLGSGADGSVYRAKYKGQLVAVKVMASAVMDGKFMGCDDPEATALLRELNVLSRLQHPNVVHLYGGCLRLPRVFLVEELMASTLCDYIHKATHKLSLQRALQVALDIGSGLNYLHNLGIVHRDLKPANILLDDVGVAKISDFGLARLKCKSYLSTNQLDAGTVAYMAPECFDPDIGLITTACDIFSLGVIIWELVTCDFPWEGVSNMAIIYRVAVQKVRMEILDHPQVFPPVLADLVGRCWSHDPTQRPSISEVLHTLDSILDSL